MKHADFPYSHRILLDLGVIDPDEVLAGDQFLLDDYGIDSLGMVRLVRQLADSFGITVRAADMGPANFATVAALERYVEGALNSGALHSGTKNDEEKP